jgi:NTE family protein
VTVSDLSRKRLIYLPWQYDEYGLDPDEQRVVDAVRASASIPYFFEPVALSGPLGTSTLVDGALVSNYPVSMFDRADGEPPRWPTIGIRLSSLEKVPDVEVDPVTGPVRLGAALVETAIEACQADHVLDPCNVARTVAVDTVGVSAVDFDIDAEQRDRLFEAGRSTAERFLARWDYPAWLADCLPGPLPAGQSRGRSSSA